MQVCMASQKLGLHLLHVMIMYELNPQSNNEDDDE